jgi:hypothetical protein
LQSDGVIVSDVEGGDDTDSSVAGEAYVEATSNQGVGLRPLIRQEHLRERDIRGNWVSSHEGGIFGFQFTETPYFGPYTVIAVDGPVEAMEIYGTTRAGFYEITPEGFLRLIFKNRLTHDTNTSVEIHQEELWTITMDDTFISFSNGYHTISMARVYLTGEMP